MAAKIMPNQSFLESIDLIDAQLFTQRNSGHKAELIEVQLQRRHNETELDVVNYRNINDVTTRVHNH